MYVHHTNWVIDREAGELPVRWNGVCPLNVLPLQGAPGLSYLASLGWLPIVGDLPAYDPATQYLSPPVGGQMGDVIQGEATEVLVTWTVLDLPEEPAGIDPPSLIASAFGVRPLPVDYDIALDGPFNLVAAVYLDVGYYLAFFQDEQPDTDYFVLSNDGAAVFSVEKGTGYLAISVTDSGGTPYDPAVFNMQIYRL